MFPAQIPPIILLSRRLMSGGQKGYNANAKTNAAPPREVDHGNGKEVPFSVEHKQVEPIVETVPNQALTNRNKDEKLLNEELLANDSPGG
jgi:hypothetical protein